MTSSSSEAVFGGIRNFKLEIFQICQEDGGDPFAGVVEMMPKASLPAVRAFIADLLHRNLDWRELDRRWRDAGSNMLFGSEEQMRAFLAEVLRHVELRMAKT